MPVPFLYNPFSFLPHGHDDLDLSRPGHDVAWMTYLAKGPERETTPNLAQCSRDEWACAFGSRVRSLISASLVLLMLALGAPFSESHAHTSHVGQGFGAVTVESGQPSNHSDQSDKILDHHCIVCPAAQVVITKPSLPMRTDVATLIRYRVRNCSNMALASPSPLFKPPRV
jgi:hypothetical protein